MAWCLVKAQGQILSTVLISTVDLAIYIYIYMIRKRDPGVT